MKSYLTQQSLLLIIIIKIKIIIKTPHVCNESVNWRSSLSDLNLCVVLLWDFCANHSSSMKKILFFSVRTFICAHVIRIP